MSLTAPVVDGKIQDISASKDKDSLTSKGSGGKNSLDKDAFLQLLVAQMKYQDPLEPTSNTEFISQFATFSELEEMQNMRLSMDIQRAQDLVGKEVIIRTTNSKTGNTTFENGIVEYIVVENGKPYLAIEDKKYSLDELDTVVDKDYSEALSKATKFVNKLKSFPSVELLTTEYMKDVFELQESLEEMSAYEKSFLGEDVRALLDKYIKKMKDLMALEGLTYEKEVIPTTEDLLQDLLDKIDKIIGEMGSISGGSGSGGADGGEGDTDGSGKVDGNGGKGDTNDSGKVDGNGGKDETGGSGSVDGDGGSGDTEGSGNVDGDGGSGSGETGGGSTDNTEGGSGDTESAT